MPRGAPEIPVYLFPSSRAPTPSFQKCCFQLRLDTERFCPCTSALSVKTSLPSDRDFSARLNELNLPECIRLGLFSSLLNMLT